MIANPGCAARAWAMMFNRFAVRTNHRHMNGKGFRKIRATNDEKFVVLRKSLGSLREH